MTLTTILNDSLKGKFIEVYLCKTTANSLQCFIADRIDAELKFALVKEIKVTNMPYEGDYIEVVVDLCGVDYSIPVEMNTEIVTI